jgi:hypothetical protein
MCQSHVTRCVSAFQCVKSHRPQFGVGWQLYFMQLEVNGIFIELPGLIFVRHRHHACAASAAVFQCAIGIQPAQHQCFSVRHRHSLACATSMFFCAPSAVQPAQCFSAPSASCLRSISINVCIVRHRHHACAASAVFQCAIGVQPAWHQCFFFSLRHRLFSLRNISVRHRLFSLRSMRVFHQAAEPVAC